MKKSEFKSFVKEIIKEVISEIDGDVNEMAKQHNQYPKDDPQGTEGGKTSGEKINQRNDSWKKHMGMHNDLKKIHDEPEFKEKLRALQQRKGDLDTDTVPLHPGVK